MTSRGAAYGLSAQVANKIASKRNPEAEAEILGWIGAIIGEKLPNGKFEDVLRDGTVLCRMIQKLVPGSVPKISTRGGKFEHMENINNFLNVCRRVGIPAVDLFQTVDLYENRNIPAVVQCLNSLARKCNLHIETTSSSSSGAIGTSARKTSTTQEPKQLKVSTSTSEGPDGKTTSTTTTTVTTTTTKKAGGEQQQQVTSTTSTSSTRLAQEEQQQQKQLQQQQQRQFQRQDSKSEARDMSSHREDMIQRRQREAAESKARTLQMYDNMAKSGNAGDRRDLDIGAYRGKESGKLLLSGAALQKRDYVEETIRERVRASEENKKRLLAAYDYAAKTQPAGTVRDVDFESFKGVDVSAYEEARPNNASTFRASNGVPSVVKVNSSVPSTPVIDIGKAPSFSQEPQLDAYERALRQRKQEADERKRRTLAAYDAIARSGVCGPKIVVKEELEHMEIPEGAEQEKPKFSSTTSFSGGYARI